ncbi:MAG: hypothetical protein ACLP5H_19795 [Desulfomonilaceae bacterium]
MGTPDESHEEEKPREPFKFIGLASMIEEIESRSPEDKFFVCAEHRQTEGQQIACESRIRDEILSAACDCHGDSCCC